MRHSPIKVSLDTSVMPCDVLIRDAGLGFEFAIVTVSARELEGSSFQAGLNSVNKLVETAVYGESRWDECAWGADDDPLERILEIVGNGSFPKPPQRDQLSRGQRRQLRDAMILSAHIREKRDVFVTNDRRAFVEHGRKAKLEAEFRIQIMTSEEFLAFAQLRTPA